MRAALRDAAEILRSLDRGWRLILLSALVIAVSMFATAEALNYFVPAPSPPAPQRVTSCAQ